MKIAPARLAAFLQRPDPEIRALLLYGPDAGLVRERADNLARTVCADLADPFRVADLNGAALAADPARLADEAAQLSLIGGRRVVRVRAATDVLARLFAGFFNEVPGEALVVVEAAELSSSSALRRAFEGSPSGAAIGCYPDAPRDRAAVIRESLAAHRVSASRDATQYLVDHLGEDRLVTRSELDKLALYVGDGGRVELEDAVLSVGDTAGLDLDDAIMAAAEGDTARTRARPRPRLPGRRIRGDDCPRNVAPSSPATRDGGKHRCGRQHRRGDAGRTSADLFQAPGWVPTATRGVAGAAAARGARPSLPRRNWDENNRSSGGDVVP